MISNIWYIYTIPMEHSYPPSISCCHQFSFSSSVLSLLRFSTCTSTALPPFLAFLVAGAADGASPSSSFLFFLPESHLFPLFSGKQWEKTAKFLKSHQKWWPPGSGSTNKHGSSSSPSNGCPPWVPDHRTAWQQKSWLARSLMDIY